MKQYEVFVVRAEYVGRTVKVQADSPANAKKRALEIADSGDLDFPAGADSVEYMVEEGDIVEVA